jgi:hypothetical protein
MPIATLVVAALLAASQPFAEQPASGRLAVTVVDPSEAVIPNATVTVTGQDDATAAGGARTAATSGVGLATIDGLVPGRYTVKVEFPGFQAAVVRDVRVRGGETRRKVMLQIEKVDEQLTVARDKQTTALDPMGAAFSTVLTREQIAALPDDPDEMEAALKAMAPPGASVRVDGFSGGKLPPKSQIRSIRLPRMDMMAAQNHGGMGGMLFIDIMTQPGIGPLRGSADFGFRDDALNARNPFVSRKGDERMERYGASVSRTIKPNKSSFALTAQAVSQYDTGNLLAALPNDTVAAPVRQPMETYSFTGRLDQAINKDHAVRFSFQRSDTSRRNQGVGSYDLPGRAYQSDLSDTVLRFSENGPLSRRFFAESRLQLHWTGNEARSAIEAPTIRVLDAFTSGGAQQKGGSNTFDFEAAFDLDYVRGRHSMRAGFLLEGGRYHSNDITNYLGTYTFSSLADYEAGRPRAFTRRVGDPELLFRNVQAGVYVQDDFRVSRSVMLSYGLRYEAQSLVSDQNNFSPRVTATWSPFKSGRTSIRGGLGFFSDWLGVATYKQTLLVDGYRLREVNIVDPGYPDPGVPGAMPPTNRYELDPALALPASTSANVGVDQQLIGAFRVNATYTYRRGSSLARGRNLNAPVGGVRPDPSFGNVVDVVSDAASRVHSLNVGASLIMPTRRRTLIAANYTLSRSRTNTTGAFGLPASGDAIEQEWGPSVPLHRFGATASAEVVRNLGLSVNARVQSGSPYNVTTGFDPNGDGLFIERPDGVSRNSALAAGQWDIGARLAYSIGFGKRPQGTGGGGTQVMVMIGGSGGGAPTASMTGGPDNKRFHIEFYASAQNVTNHSNYIGYSGTMTSPFFAQPTSVLNPRKIELGTRFTF